MEDQANPARCLNKLHPEDAHVIAAPKKKKDRRVDVQVGSGFLNYINGYVVKASDCINFSAKEYSAAETRSNQRFDTTPANPTSHKDPTERTSTQ